MQNATISLVLLFFLGSICCQKCTIWKRISQQITENPSAELSISQVESFVEAAKSTPFSPEFRGLPFKVLEKIPFEELKNENLSLIQALLRFELMLQSVDPARKRIALPIVFQKYQLKRKVLAFIVSLYERVGHLPSEIPVVELEDSFDEDQEFLMPFYNGCKNIVDQLMNNPKILAVDKARNIVQYAYKHAIPSAPMMCKLLKVEKFVLDQDYNPNGWVEKMKEILKISQKVCSSGRYCSIKQKLFQSSGPNANHLTIDWLDCSFSLLLTTIRTEVQVEDLELPHRALIAPSKADSKEALGVYLLSWDILMRKFELVTSEIASSSLCIECMEYLQTHGFTLTRGKRTNKIQTLLSRSKIPQGSCSRCKVIGQVLSSAEVKTFSNEFSPYVKKYFEALFHESQAVSSGEQFFDCVHSILHKIADFKLTVQFADRGWANSVLLPLIKQIQRDNPFPAIKVLSERLTSRPETKRNIVQILQAKWNRIESEYVKHASFKTISSLVSGKLDSELNVQLFKATFQLGIRDDVDLIFSMRKMSGSSEAQGAHFDQEIAYYYDMIVDFVQTHMHYWWTEKQFSQFKSAILTKEQICWLSKYVRVSLSAIDLPRSTESEFWPFNSSQVELLNDYIRKAFEDLSNAL